MKKYYSVLTIAGSDSGGGAGIQADLKTFAALGCYGTSAITAVTVQNTMGVSAIHPIPADIVAAQIRAVMTDIKPSAVKIGMVHSAELAKVIGDELKLYPRVPVVFDPVMVATSGDRLIEDNTLDALRQHLFPYVDLLTPNIPEASVLSGIGVSSRMDMVPAADNILTTGCNSVLIKGGHLNGDCIVDVLCSLGRGYSEFRHDKIETVNTHGTGCTLSSAIAAYLARGYSMDIAVRNAIGYVHNAILHGAVIRTGNGNGPLNHSYEPGRMLVSDSEPLYT